MSVNVTQLLDQPRSAAHSAPAAQPSPTEAPRGPVEGRAGPGTPVWPRTARRTPQTTGETPWQDAWLAC